LRTGGTEDAAVRQIEIVIGAVANFELAGVGLQHQFAVGENGIELRPSGKGVAPECKTDYSCRG
jgi:hypothetical protein